MSDNMSKNPNERRVALSQAVIFSVFQGQSVGTVAVLSSAFQPQAQEQTGLVLDETAFRIGSLAPVDSSGILLHR